MTNDEIRKNDKNKMTNYSRKLVVDGSAVWEQVFWGARDDLEKGAASELREGADGKRVYDLEERTARFGEAILCFARKIPHNWVNDRLIGQLVGAGTSIG